MVSGPVADGRGFLNSQFKNNYKVMENQTGFSIIRADRAGVFLGKIIESNGSTLVITNARRLYYWSGALDVITIALSGVGNPSRCKFSAQLGGNDKSTILNVIEYHPVTEAALTILNSIPVWKS
jgi:hypothetical protein